MNIRKSNHDRSKITANIIKKWKRQSCFKKFIQRSFLHTHLKFNTTAIYIFSSKKRKKTCV